MRSLHIHTPPLFQMVPGMFKLGVISQERLKIVRLSGQRSKGHHLVSSQEEVILKLRRNSLSLNAVTLMIGSD